MILMIGPGGSGLTFLSWSIMYLRGDEDYTLLTKKNVKIVNNPLLDKTAHGQTIDHIHQISDFKKLKNFTDQSVVYAVLTPQSDLDYFLQVDGKKIIFDSSTCTQELFARMVYTTPNNSFNTLIQSLSSKYDKQLIKKVLFDCFYY